MRVIVPPRRIEFMANFLERLVKLDARFLDRRSPLCLLGLDSLRSQG